MGMAIYTVIQAIHTVSTPYFPTLFPIQNTGYLHRILQRFIQFKSWLFTPWSPAHVAPALIIAPLPVFRNCSHLSNSAYTYTCVFSLSQQFSRFLNIYARPMLCTTSVVK